MSKYMTDNRDYQPENWWATVSGAGTAAAAVESWADDYTRHRTTLSPTYQSVDALQGRAKSVRDKDLADGLYPSHK